MILSFKIILGFSLIILYLLYKVFKLNLKAKKVEYEFTSIVNHTFRTPLTKIAWFAKELEKDMPINERSLLVQNLENTNMKLLQIVDLILGVRDIKNTSGYLFEATSIRDLIEKTIAKYREEINKKNISFEVASFKEIPLLTIDLNKITFVIDSVIENAIYYTPTNGQIKIENEATSKKLTLKITDTGMGLRFKDKMRIFSKFYRSKRAVLAYPDGMGLKLYLAKQIIKRHKGKIFIYSNGINKGSSVFIQLPF